jgi:hypothetical protein
MNSPLPYLLPSVTWIRQRAVASDAEIVCAHARGYLESDEVVALAWRAVLTKEAEKWSELLATAEASSSLYDKYFVLIFLRLFESWFDLPNPYKALEYLVLDFQNSDLLFVHDKLLPSSVGGIAEGVYFPGDQVRQYQAKAEMHAWLTKYVVELMKSDLLDRTLF